MSTRPHDRVCWAYWQHLMAQGHQVAWEAGIPGGRVDIVRVDAQGRWVELYEVKWRKPAETGVAQLLRYGEIVGTEPELTLVVTPDAYTASLAQRAASAGVRLDVFAGLQQQLFDTLALGENSVLLPAIHPESARRISEKNRAAAAAKREAVAA